MASSTIRSRYLRSGAGDDVATIPLLVTQDGQRIALSHLVSPEAQVSQRLVPADGQLLSEEQRLLPGDAHLLPDDVGLQGQVAVSQAHDHRQGPAVAVAPRPVAGVNGHAHTRVQDAQRYVDTPELLDDESADHQLSHLSQDQLIQVALDPDNQQFGVVPMSGQRLLVQTPAGEWTESKLEKNFNFWTRQNIFFL